jgi:proton-translocating NADH-quinone oxidoreductase chain M
MLSAFIFLPLIAALFILSPIFPNHTVKIRRFAKSFAAAHLLGAILLLTCFDRGEFYNYSWSLPYEPILGLGVKISFAMDELGALMCVLTSLLVLLALVASKAMLNSRHKLFYSLVLMLQSAVLGVFCASDLLVFFACWQMTFVPIYFLISLWGGQKAKKSAMKYLLYNFGASLFMLCAIAFLFAYYQNWAAVPLDIPNLIQTASALPHLVQLACFSGFLIAFLVAIPVFPLHNWLQDAHTEAPTPVSMLLAGILLKMGAWGLIRFNLQTFPTIMEIFAPWIILAACVGIIWASCLAIVQQDIKRTVALSSIAHMGIIVAGICSMTGTGLSGAIFHMIAHGLIVAGLFFGVGMIYLRFKTYKTELLGGAAEMMPNLAALMLIICLAAVAMPLTVGFTGVFASILGAFSTQLATYGIIRICALIACLGVLLGVVYIFKMYTKVFYHISSLPQGKIADLSRHQMSIMIILAAGVLILGVYPSAVFDIIGSFVTKVGL